MQLNSDLLSKYSKLALAVSGGPDSIAMLHLLHSQGKNIVALTVDHNLRAESKEEAIYVASLCKELEIEHHILEWQHNGIKSNIHDKARKARYNFMTNFCHDNRIEALCTAHHEDDRIENFFIRIHQGAGLLGLIDKDHIIYNGINVIRPLFHLRKQEILEYLDEKKLKYFEDKSNEDPKYLRSNIRKWISIMPKELDPDLFKKRIISVKSNLERTSELVERIFEEELSKVKIAEEGYAIISSLPQDKEIAYMLLSKVLGIIGDGGDLIRLDSIERLYNSTKSKDTLGGCIIYRHCEEAQSTDLATQKKTNNRLLIIREFGKNPPKDTSLKDQAIWDDRYKIHTDKSYDELSISYLTQNEYAEIKKHLAIPDHLQKNKEIIFTLPVVKNLEKVIAIPHINYYDDAYDDLGHNLKYEFIRKNR